MPIPTGSRTPWEEWPGDDDFLDVKDEEVIYFREGELLGSLDFLVEALRADGVVYNLAAAYRAVEGARFLHTHYGYADEAPVVCDSEWSSVSGNEVDYRRPCIFAIIST